MPIADNIFAKCVPAIGTDVVRCGAVTACDIATATDETLAGIFTDAEGDFRNMSSLLVAMFEMKACGVRTNGLFDFLMASSRLKNKSLRKMPSEAYGTRFNVEPFIMADQQSVINQEYWEFQNGLDPGGTPDWQLDVFSNHGMPLDIRFFNESERIYANGYAAGGSITRTAYRIISAAIVGSVIRLQLASENFTFGAAAKIENPATGFLTRGTANISDFESWCEQPPGLNGTKSVPFWLETDRWTTCIDELYEGYFNDLQKNNAYFAKFGDIPAAKLNKQILEDFQRKFVNSFFWNKRISANQTLANYRNLNNILTADTGALYLPNEGRCVGKKANAIGQYELLMECGRVFDQQGAPLNINELFELIYSLSRARSDQGGNGTIIESFTDRSTRARIQRAMIQYYDDESSGLLRLNVTVGQAGALGFVYDSYRLIDPAGVEWRVVSNHFFDDFKAEAVAAGVPFAGNMLWFLDFGTIYPGILDSNRVVHKTGDLKALAAVDSGFACVMRNPTREVSLNSLWWTGVNECPFNSAILEGFNDTVPTSSGRVGSYDDYASIP